MTQSQVGYAEFEEAWKGETPYYVMLSDQTKVVTQHPDMQSARKYVKHLLIDQFYKAKLNPFTRNKICELLVEGDVDRALRVFRAMVDPRVVQISRGPISSVNVMCSEDLDEWLKEELAKE